MRPVFFGNFEYDTRHSDLERLFGKYGRLERVDMKSGTFLQRNMSFFSRDCHLLPAKLHFHACLYHVVPTTIFADSRENIGICLSIRIIDGYAFVYFEDERDAEDAIRRLDNAPFGYEKRRLSVEWAKGERGRPRGEGKAVSNMKPTKTLFVINFDPNRTKEHDIKKHFEPYGKVINVRIRRNFSFIQFATQEDATKALEATQRSKILDRVISVEYALKDDDERDDRHAGGSPRRSLSPAYRRRPSPDYGRPRSPEYDRYKGPAAYDRHRSPAAYDRRRSPAAYERRRSPAAYERRRSPDYGRQRSPVYDRYRSRSPVPRGRP